MSLPRRIALRASASLVLVSLAGCGPAPVDAVAVSSRSLTTGLVAHWTFDDAAGSTTVADRSGNRYDGQLTGMTASWVPAARFGGGLHLQSGDTVTFPGFQQASRDWTVSVWIRLSAADRDTFATDRAVLLTAEALMGGWEIEFDPRPGFEWLEASYYVAPPTNDFVILDCKCIEIDRWLHWTAVFDFTDHRFNLYYGTVLTDSSFLPAPILPGSPELGIGRWYRGERSISGTLDDYAIWSRALTADEVAAIDAKAVPDPL